MGTKRVTLVGFVTVAVSLMVLSAAWACTGQPQVFSVSPLTATAGSEVTMRGNEVAEGTPIELRWNGVAGPKLAEATAAETGNFVLAFTVPADAEPGVYSLMVVAGQGEAEAGVGRTTFEVAADPQAASAAGGPGTPQGFHAPVDSVGLDVPASPASATALTAGVLLLAVGASGLFGGFAVATVSRRRALAHQPLR